MKYEDVPKVKRTHCYVMYPVKYDIICPSCKGHNIQWSEFESHHNGVFSGPIPIGISEALGISFHRINIETGEIVKFSDDLDKFNSTWVKSDELVAYEKENYFPNENK